MTKEELEKEVVYQRDGWGSEERSKITPDYARNFICDFILGKVQHNIGEPQFDFGN